MSYQSTYTGEEIDSALSILNNMWIVLEVSGVAANSTVTAVLNEYNLTATANSSGVCSFDIPSYGLWIISGTIGVATISRSININQVKLYTMTLSL